MRGRAWLTCQSGNRTLAPFDGITRIRFKGSVAGATLSAIAAPPQYCFLVRIGLAQAKSIHAQTDGQRTPLLCLLSVINLLMTTYPAGDVCGGGAAFMSV
jgi:hypothetical protein